VTQGWGDAARRKVGEPATHGKGDAVWHKVGEQ
jgi:hypothetical protein